MAETNVSGRRAAATKVDEVQEIAAAATEQVGGRRARRVAEVSMGAPAPTHANYVGRRFETVRRYGVAPRQADLHAAESVEGNVIAFPSPTPSVNEANGALVQELKRAPKKSHNLGFTHKVAAVAAVSGLALAAVSPQLASSVDKQEHTVQAERAANSAVVDVKAPDAGGLDVQRASFKSERNPEVAAEEKFSEVMSASGGDVTAIESAGLLNAPVNSNRITSPFGHRKNPTGPGYMIHSGMDYGVACGTEVRASAAGTVTVAGWAGHSGKRVTIEHGNGLETGYSHNSQLLVNVGDKVERGDLIALSGTTGNSTGCHVHFEVIVDGDFKDPRGWL